MIIFNEAKWLNRFLLVNKQTKTKRLIKILLKNETKPHSTKYSSCSCFLFRTYKPSRTSKFLWLCRPLQRNSGPVVRWSAWFLVCSMIGWLGFRYVWSCLLVELSKHKKIIFFWSIEALKYFFKNSLTVFDWYQKFVHRSKGGWGWKHKKTSCGGSCLLQP